MSRELVRALERVAERFRALRLWTGLAACWGDGGFSELGNGSINDRTAPSMVSTNGVLSGKFLSDITTGQLSTCGATSDGIAVCWGSNSSGQLGNNSTSDSSVPVLVSTSGALAGKTVKAVSAGGRSACALATDSTIACWGSNVYGQLGNGTTTLSRVPVAVTKTGTPLAGKTITQISVGTTHACALTSDSSPLTPSASLDSIPEPTTNVSPSAATATDEPN